MQNKKTSCEPEAYRDNFKNLLHRQFVIKLQDAETGCYTEDCTDTLL